MLLFVFLLLPFSKKNVKKCFHSSFSHTLLWDWFGRFRQTSDLITVRIAISSSCTACIKRPNLNVSQQNSQPDKRLLDFKLRRVIRAECRNGPVTLCLSGRCARVEDESEREGGAKLCSGG